MGARGSRRQQGGLQGYGDPYAGYDPYDPYGGLGGYGGSYDPYGPGAGGYRSGYITTSVSPGQFPLGIGGANPLGLGNRLGGSGLPPKVRVIFIPQGGAG